MTKQAGQPDGSPLSRTDLAYLAGLIDGEGTIGIERRHKVGEQGRVNPRFQAYVCVVNSSYDMIEWIQTRVPGSVSSKRKEREHHKQTWRWLVGDQKALALLTKLRPYIVVKGRQADIAIDFVANRGANRRRRMLTDEELARREGLWLRVKALNARGVAPAETKRRDAA